MPWKEVLVPEARRRFVLATRQKSESFASLCRRFGISRKSGYKWLARYAQGGGRALCDASRRPHYCAKAHRSFWREALRRARRARPHWGPKKLRPVLRKAFPALKRVPAESTLGRWLGQGDLSVKRQRRARPGPILAWKRLRVARGCNALWSVDFKGWFRTGDGRRCEALTVRDVHSRFILGVVFLPNQSERAVRQALRRIFCRYGLPQAIRTDHGAPFGGKGALGLSRLSVWWLRLGIAVEFIRRGHPQDNGAHEQMHRVLKAETAAPPAQTLRGQKRRTGRWIFSYNEERPHEALGQQVPARFYRPSARRLPRRCAEASYPGGWQVRRVRNRGQIKWLGRERFIGRAFVGELVGLKKRHDRAQGVYFQRHLIGLLYEQDVAGMRPVSIAPPA
ncbi:MAG: integrase core domain-containing protein [Acidobacteria bacterium]|nr:integrase core domain-containing protein [Acidobacteriota bacterium]